MVIGSDTVVGVQRVVQLRAGGEHRQHQHERDSARRREAAKQFGEA